MRVNARLTVVDGKVACPSSGQWEQLGHCARCIDLQKLDATDAHRLVVACRPQVESFGKALDRVIRV
jgi:hypothetical protein